MLLQERGRHLCHRLMRHIHLRVQPGDDIRRQLGSQRIENTRQAGYFRQQFVAHNRRRVIDREEVLSS